MLRCSRDQISANSIQAHLNRYINVDYSSDAKRGNGINLSGVAMMNAVLGLIGRPSVIYESAITARELSII